MMVQSIPCMTGDGTNRPAATQDKHSITPRGALELADHSNRSTLPPATRTVSLSEREALHLVLS